MTPEWNGLLWGPVDWNKILLSDNIACCVLCCEEEIVSWSLKQKDFNKECMKDFNKQGMYKRFH